jgi:hypothetical protein
MLVKSIDVPDVDETAVPLTIGANVPVTATKVCVFDPATAGAAKVIEPDVLPNTDTGGVDIPAVPSRIIVILLAPQLLLPHHLLSWQRHMQLALGQYIQLELFHQFVRLQRFYVS